MTSGSVPDAPFTRREASAAGISGEQLRRLAGAGIIRQVFRGVYVPGSWPGNTETRARAAAHVLPPHCVVADRSAAALHGIDVLDYAELDVVPKLEVVSVNAAATRRGGMLGGERDLSRDEVCRVGGVPVTTPVRTACDIACLRGRHRALATLDAFREQHGLTERDLISMLPRFVGRRGVIQLRELIGLSTTGRDSQAESWVAIDIHDEGYPMPKAQTWVDLPGWGRVKIENAYEHLRIGVEYDGEEHHSAEADVAHDSGRRAALADADWAIIVVRRDGFSREGRQRWLGELARAWADRAPDPLGRRKYSRGPDQWRPGRR